MGWLKPPTSHQRQSGNQAAVVASCLIALRSEREALWPFGSPWFAMVPLRSLAQTAFNFQL